MLKSRRCLNPAAAFFVSVTLALVSKDTPPGLKWVVPAAPVSNWALKSQFADEVQRLCHRHDMASRFTLCILSGPRHN
jgi:hypothetical protein